MNASLDGFFDCLQRKLAAPLPGRPAQALMAPLPRPGWHPDDRPDEPARQSGVLVLLYSIQGRLHVPLILRPTYDGTHSGQVAFPGGGSEEGDGDLTETALRETHEELGIAPQEVEVLGTLTDLYIRPSNYEVYPTVGRLNAKPVFRPDPSEVAQLLEVPLATLLDPAHQRKEVWQLADRSALVPLFRHTGPDHLGGNSDDTQRANRRRTQMPAGWRHIWWPPQRMIRSSPIPGGSVRLRS